MALIIPDYILSRDLINIDELHMCANDVLISQY